MAVPQIRKPEQEPFMHEMGIAMQIAEIAVASIPDELKPARVERVNVKVGKLSAVVTDSLRFCFEVITRETPLEGAELAVQEVPVTARCKDCRHEWTIENPVFSCSRCSSGAVELLTGRELDIESIEIAEKDDGSIPSSKND
jgi:hydrogenase nickel incorporation protein HypA/HybF